MNPDDPVMVVFTDLEGNTIYRTSYNTFYELEKAVDLAFQKGVKKVIEKNGVITQVKLYPPHLLGPAYATGI